MSAIPQNAFPTTSDPTRQETLFVVEEECQFAADTSKVQVVIESRNMDFPRAIDELNGPDARNLALAYAATRGMGNPAINGSNIGPYAVNNEGLSLERVGDDHGKPLNPRHPRMQPAAYRVEVPIARRLM